MTISTLYGKVVSVKNSASSLDPELAGLERRTWRYLGDDGLADLLLGLALLCFGVGMVAELGMLAALGPAICVMNFKPIHARWIVPRRGVVRLRTERRRFLKGAMARMVALQIVLILVGVGIWQVMGSDAARARLQNFMPLAAMIPFPVLIALLGRWFDVPRFYAQAAILLALVIGLHFAGAESGWPLVLSGGLLFAHGLWMLTRFFRTHPRPQAA